MSSVNSVTLSGFVGKDPVIRYGSDGHAFTSFSLCVEGAKNKKTGEYNKFWFDIQVSGPIVEKLIIPYVKKGTHAGVAGKLRNRIRKSQDGTEKLVTEIVAYEVNLLPNGKRENAPQSISDEPNGNLSHDDFPDDDIPF